LQPEREKMNDKLTPKPKLKKQTNKE